MSEPEEGKERRPYPGEVDEESEQPKKKGIDLSAPQVVAGGVATMTAATAASFLGVYGTIAGAAVMSVISTAGTAITQRFLEDGRDKAKETARAVAGRSGVTVVRNTRAGAPSPSEEGATWATPPETDVTRTMPTVGATEPSTTAFAAGGLRDTDTGVDTGRDDGEDEESAEDERTWWQRYRVYAILAGGLFVGVMVVILVFELFTGRSLSDTVRGEDGHSSPSLLGGVSESEDVGGDTDTGDNPDTDGGQNPGDREGQDGPETDREQPGGSNEEVPQVPEGGDQEGDPGQDDGSGGQPEEGGEDPAPQEGPGGVQPDDGGAQQ